ncbi:MAG: hypothetical protein J07HX5_01892 [halophilic archaeon J07HX5]|nr:MAG: hypothetical protein J07HX5_01892 [halophilic archaeon J07HX5]
MFSSRCSTEICFIFDTFRFWFEFVYLLMQVYIPTDALTNSLRLALYIVFRLNLTYYLFVFVVGCKDDVAHI